MKKKYFKVVEIDDKGQIETLVNREDGVLHTTFDTEFEAEQFIHNYNGPFY